MIYTFRFLAFFDDQTLRRSVRVIKSVRSRSTQAGKPKWWFTIIASAELLSHMEDKWSTIDPRSIWSLRSSLSRPQTEDDSNSSKDHGSSLPDNTHVSMDQSGDSASLSPRSALAQVTGANVDTSDLPKDNVHAQSTGQEPTHEDVVVISSSSVPNALSLSDDPLSTVSDCDTFSPSSPACNHGAIVISTPAPFLGQTGSLQLETRQGESPVIKPSPQSHLSPNGIVEVQTTSP